MKQNKYWKLFSTSFYLRAFTFGGGFVIIPLLKKKFVDELDWIDEEEMLDLAAISQSSPGSVSINASILVGYKIAGVVGVLMTIIGTVIPPLFILTIISHFYNLLKDNIVFELVLTGMQAGVAAVIIDVVITMTKSLFDNKIRFPLYILIGSFIASFVFDLNIMIIVLVAGTLGALYQLGFLKVGGRK